MTETERIADLLDRAYRGQAWHGPSVMEALAEVDAPMATEAPLKGVHSIWELTRHIIVWLETVTERIETGHGEPVTPEKDWPTDEKQDEKAWHELKQRLDSSHQNARALIASLDDARLDEDLPECEPAQVYLVLHGLIHHHLYHAGQIQMLKRALQAVGRSGAASRSERSRAEG